MSTHRIYTSQRVKVTLLRVYLCLVHKSLFAYKLLAGISVLSYWNARWVTKKSDNYSSVKRSVCSGSYLQRIPLTFLARTENGAFLSRIHIRRTWGRNKLPSGPQRNPRRKARNATQRNATSPCLGSSPTRLVGFEIFDSSISYVCRRVTLAWTRRGECTHARTRRAGTLSTYISRISYSDTRIYFSMARREFGKDSGTEMDI